MNILCDWYGNISAIMNAISCFYANQISGSQLVIVENVHRLIELRDDLTYEELSRSDIRRLLFDLCCN